MENTNYTIQSGDTLSEIATKFASDMVDTNDDGSINYWDLVAANNIKNPNLIFAGDELIIPTEQKTITINNNSETAGVYKSAEKISVTDNNTQGKIDEWIDTPPIPRSEEWTRLPIPEPIIHIHPVA